MINPIYDRSQDLIDSLSPPEITSVYNYLSFFKPKNLDEKTTKLELLLDHLSNKKSDKEPDDPEEPIFKSVTSERKAYETLENKIVDSLLLDINLYRNGKYECGEHIVLTLSKELLKAQLLKKRGYYSRAYKLAGNVINHANKCESYDHAIEATNLQLSMINFLSDIDDFQDKLSGLQHLEFCRLGKRKAVYLFYELKLKKFHHIKENFDMFLTSSEKELSKLAERTGSVIVDYIRHFFVKEILEAKGEIHEAYRYIEQLWKIGRQMNNRTPLIDPWELTYEQARLSYSLQFYHDSVMFSEICIKRLPPENEIYQKALIQGFLARCMTRSFDKAERLVHIALNCRLLKEMAHGNLLAKWYYYSAVSAFFQGQFKKSLKQLKKTQKLEKIKTEYNLVVRLLRIINYVEDEKWDDCDRQIDLMHKYIHRQQLHKLVKNLGLEGFIDLMRELKLKSYQFNHFSKHIDRISEKAIRDQQNARIKVDLLDMISFGHWFKAKVKDKSPDFFIELYISDKNLNYYTYGKMVS